MQPTDLIAAVRDVTKTFAERETRDSDAYPSTNIDDLRNAGVLSAPFAAGMGGSGASVAEMVEATRIIAAASPSTALIASMPMGLAGIFALPATIAPDEHQERWREQAQEVADEYRAGKLYAACNSEKGAGGSLKDIKTVAKQNRGGDALLSGEKILASSGRHAQYFFSTAKVVEEADRVELFFVRTNAPGVEIKNDWNGFGMRSTESQSVVYRDAPAHAMIGFPDFIEVVQPVSYWYCLFAAIPLGCAGAMLHALADPPPRSPALRMRFSDAFMRYESLSAYLNETAEQWRAAAGPAYAMRVLRTKTYVTQESTKLCAELFSLGGGRHYTRTSALARLLADSFAGTALRPPLALALDTLVEHFTLE